MGGPRCSCRGNTSCHCVQGWGWGRDRRDHHHISSLRRLGDEVVRRVKKLIAAGAAAILACEEPMTAPPSGGLSVHVLTGAVTPPLDSARIIIVGPTARTIRIAPGTTDTIHGLAPGLYVVALEGFVGTDVDRFGEAKGVRVVSGQNTAVSLTLRSFLPVLGSIASPVPAARFEVAYSRVSDASSYRIEWSRDSLFASGLDTTVTDTTVVIEVDDPGVYYVRVRARNEFGSVGRPSQSQPVDLVFVVFASISAGSRHTCGVSSQGDAYCWGDNYRGALGIGRGSLVPAIVSTSLKFRSISAGLFTC